MQATKIHQFFSTRVCNGLQNVGNTCYISTAITCLAHCLSFAYPIIANQPPDNAVVSKALREMLKTIWIRQQTCSPLVLLKTLDSSVGQMMDLFQQNDAMEFLMIFFDVLNKENGTEMKLQSLNDKLRGVQKLNDMMNCNWQNTHRQAYSYLCGLLYGQMVNQTKCNLCGSIEHVSEVFCNISLPISCFHNVEELLRQYFEQEVVTRNCDNCKLRNVSATNLCRFWRTPQVLIIHLKRFDNVNNKVNKKINVPTVLSIDQYTLRPSACTEFELKAIACHSGSTAGGHYFSIVNNPNGDWYMLDDDNHPVKLDSFESVDSRNYYILFYEVK